MIEVLCSLLLWMVGICLLFFPRVGHILWLRVAGWGAEPTLYEKQKERRKKGRIPLSILRMRCGRVGVLHWYTGSVFASLALLAIGCSVCMLWEKYILLVPLALFLASIPFLVLSIRLKKREEMVEGELETVLTLITSSYLRENVIVKAVEENLGEIKEPLLPIFRSFVHDQTLVSADERMTVRHMRTRFPHPLFESWCDTLLLCLEDRKMKETLPWVVDRLSEKRIADVEMQNARKEALLEFLCMTGMVLLNFPLLYFLNDTWFSFLFLSLAGEVVLGMTALLLAFCTYQLSQKILPQEERCP